MKDFLSIDVRKELELRHDTERDRRIADRIKAILLANKGWSYQDIAEALRLSEVSVARHIKEYLTHHKLKPMNGGSSTKLNNMQTAALIHHFEDRTYLKVSDICRYVQQTCGVIYTLAGMTCWLKNHGFSYKKPAATPAKADPAKQAAFIRQYEKLMNTTPEEEPILFGDGVHPTMATKVTYGWIRTGVRKPILTTGNRTRLNIMGTLDLAKMALNTTEHTTLNHEAMEEHFKHLRRTYPTAPKIHLILDQGSYNTSHKTVEAAKQLSIVLHHLPPYSPNLNPIERCWKIMNEHVRNNRFFGSAKEFREAILHFFNVTWLTIAVDMKDRVNDNFQRLQLSSLT